MKRILAGLLCVLLLLPTVSTVAWAASGAYAPLATIPYAFNGSRLVDSRNEIFSYGATFDPIDLTAFGYPASGSIPAGKLGLQLDVCVSGTDDVVEAIAAGREYSNYKMNQCIGVSLSGASLFGEMKTVAAFAVLAYLAAMAYDVSKKFPKA